MTVQPTDLAAVKAMLLDALPGVHGIDADTIAVTQDVDLEDLAQTVSDYFAARHAAEIADLKSQIEQLTDDVYELGGPLEPLPRKDARQPEPAEIAATTPSSIINPTIDHYTPMEHAWIEQVKAFGYGTAEDAARKAPPAETVKVKVEHRMVPPTDHLQDVAKADWFRFPYEAPPREPTSDELMLNLIMENDDLRRALFAPSPKPWWKRAPKRLGGRA